MTSIAEAEPAMPRFLARLAGDPITAAEYDSLPEEFCRDIEIVDGMVVVSPRPTRKHARVTRYLANALEAGCGEAWRVDAEVDLRLTDQPLHNRQPDVTVYRRDLAEDALLRPADVILVVEVVSPGSETTDRKIKPIVYAEVGIEHYWRVELKADMPVVHTYVLDEATSSYVAGPVYLGRVKAEAPFPIAVDLTEL